MSAVLFFTVVGSDFVSLFSTTVFWLVHAGQGYWMMLTPIFDGLRLVHLSLVP
jgi:hypothetical protein